MLQQFKLLEKHKDYVIRANDYKKKQAHITRCDDNTDDDDDDDEDHDDDDDDNTDHDDDNTDDDK